MHLYITSTCHVLAAYRREAARISEQLGFEPSWRPSRPAIGQRPISAVRSTVAAADAVLAIIGWSRGSVPSPGDGGDGLRPWCFWELRYAHQLAKPIRVLMAGESWRPSGPGGEPAHSTMLDLRGELYRLGEFFEVEVDGSNAECGPEFEKLVKRQLAAVRHQTETGTSIDSARFGFTLRRWPRPELPELPYPVLLPYSHPDLMAGRNDDLEEVCRQLQRPIPILALYSTSGVGKSSFVAGGLVPALRAGGRPVAFDRHPWEGGLGRRILEDLVDPGPESDGDLAVEVENWRRLPEVLRWVRYLGEQSAGGVCGPGQGTPILILDQFEDVLIRPEAREQRTLIGTWLAATVQRLPGSEDPPCRWLLVVREEFLGKLILWLSDVTQEARRAGIVAASALPFDLSGPDRFHSWRLAPLASCRGDGEDRFRRRVEIFRAAIETPLKQRTADGALWYPWRFASEDAERLATAFARARERCPEAPLTPELQVVLAHLLELAQNRQGGSPHQGTALIAVPDDPGELIERALEDHLRRALDHAFSPLWEHSIGALERPRVRRTRAFLALRELAEVTRLREQGLSVETLVQVIGEGGETVLRTLSNPRSRLVALRQTREGWRYALSHDRMSEIVLRLADDESACAGLGIDPELLKLRRIVNLQIELESRGAGWTPAVSSKILRRIKRYEEALIWSDPAVRWWRKVLRRSELRRRWLRAQTFLALFLAVAIASLAGTWADRRARHREMLGLVSSGGPRVAFGAVERLLEQGNLDHGEVRRELLRRQRPFDILEHGIYGQQAPRVVLEVVELALPVLQQPPGNARWIAIVTWAIDFAVPAGWDAERRGRLRRAVIETLHERAPPPDRPLADDPNWIRVPGGIFHRGSPRGQREDFQWIDRERPRHEVEISPFRMLRHEVTTSEFWRLFPEHPGSAELPVGDITWYQAYTYAAWLGGRLPTEAEWEFAAKAGCEHAYCAREGNPVGIDEVAWSLRNSRKVAGAALPQPGMRLEPNPWGFYDLLGNVWELVADWYVDYEDTPLTNPGGPFSGGFRVARGGGCLGSADETNTTARTQVLPEDSFFATGFRVVLPGDGTEVGGGREAPGS